MTVHRLAMIAATLIVMTIGCGAESPQGAAPAAPPTKAAPPTGSVAAERAVRPSPEVVALLEPDPDLEQTVSPEEVKAALEAAKTGRTTPRSATSPPVASSPAGTREPSPSAPPTNAGEEWAKLEEARKKRIEKWQERLAATTVYIGNDIWYHLGSCPSLYVYQYDLDRVLRPIYIGRPITLKRAAEASMSRHGECGPPTYELE